MFEEPSQPLCLLAVPDKLGTQNLGSLEPAS
jgi:hypothetical protein